MINLLEVVFYLNANPQLPAPLLIFADDPHSDATNNLQYNKIVGPKQTKEEYTKIGNKKH